MLTINNTKIMPGVDNTDLDDHDASEDKLWNEDFLKKYVLNMLNMLKSLYSILLKTLSALFINNIIY